MVFVLRVYRKYYVCFVYSSDVNEGAYGTYCLGGNRIGFVRYIQFSGAGHLGVGWTMEEYNLIGGFLRVLFSFSMGLLMSRVFKPIHVKGAFWICSLAIVVLLSMPYVGDGEALWMNGIYDSVCAILIFPMLVYLGASGKTTDKHSARICKFLGDISYPCIWYITLLYTCILGG